MKQLIVNADDFGRAPGVNRGIIEAHRKGIVTSTTVMINLPDAAPGLELARTEAPNLGIGLHITLTSGKPALPAAQVRSLVNERGEFYGIREWPAAMERFDAQELRAEIEAQFDAFTRLAGRAPDHLDSHHHAAYLHPAALRATLDLAAAHGLPIRAPQLDLPDEAILNFMAGMLRGLKPERAPALLVSLRAALEDGPRPRWPDYLALDYSTERPTLAALLVILTTLPDEGVTELLCHPGYVDDALRASGLVEQREDELLHLTHAATRECVQAEGIRLVTFAALS